MDGFEVTVGELREAGGAGGSVARDVAVLPLADAVVAVGDALPGGAAAAAAAALAESWQARVAATVSALVTHAEALRVAADTYGAAERAAVGALVGER